MLWDSHCHLDDPRFDGDRDAVAARARAAGIGHIVVPGVRPKAWAGLGALAARHAEVVVAVGVHPQVVPELSDDEVARATGEGLAWAAAELRAVAIGECGLDGGTGDPAGQERWLRLQIGVARELGLPVIVHVLRAHDAALRVLRAERVGEVGGVLHSYSGGAELVPVYAGLGLSFSFAGPVSWPGARRPVEAARVVPADRLLVETDAPDQAPAPHRGGRCEPAHLGDVVAALAAARDEDVSTTAARTVENARRLFGRRVEGAPARAG